MSSLFFISRSFSRWASLACHLLSRFLCLSLSLYSKFVNMTINLSLILKTTRIQKQFPLSVFVFIDSLVVSALQEVGGYAISAKITSSCIWVAIPVYWVILHWYACGADGRSFSRVYSHEITKHLSDGWWAPGWVMGRLPHFLRYGATLVCVELGYKTKGQFLGEHHVVWTGKKSLFSCCCSPNGLHDDRPRDWI